MPFGNLGMWEVILILVVLLLVFGAKRLPEIGSALGKGIREFKGSVKEIEEDINRSKVSSGPQQNAQREPLPRGEAQQPQAPRQQSEPPGEASAPPEAPQDERKDDSG